MSGRPVLDSQSIFYYPRLACHQHKIGVRASFGEPNL
jgi:hypothetical protein